LVPVFVELFQTDDEDGTSAVTTVAISAMVAITAVGMVAAPLIFRIYLIGVNHSRAQHLASVGVPLMRFFIPQVLFYGLTALATALLNSRRSFAAPAFAPVLNNIVVCSMLLALPRLAKEPLSLSLLHRDFTLLALLGLGTTAGIVAMTVVLWPALRRAGVRTHWNFDLHHPAVRKVGALSGWTLGYVAANQVALFTVLALATRVGAASAYTYAFVFFQLPHGLFAVSIMTTFAPDLAGLARERDLEPFRERFGLGLRLIALVIVPAAIGLGLLSRPLIALLERGRFTATSADLTSDVLIGFAFGLVGFSLYLFSLRGFYALKDTRTPFLVNVVENGLNVLFALMVVNRFGAGGLGGAYSAAYSIAAVLALAALSRRVGGLGLRRSAPTLCRIAAAAALMAAAVWGITHMVGGPRGVEAVIRVAAGVVVGLGVYAAAVVLLRVHEVTDLVDRVMRRRRAL
jgi:putative peptidoglycan lipid II flippase